MSQSKRLSPTLDASLSRVEGMPARLKANLSMNPAQLMQKRYSHLQSGWFGESYQARNHAVENLLAEAKDIERKAV